MYFKVVWHPNSDILASASYDNLIKLYKEDQSECDWICTATLNSHTSTVWGLAFDVSGNRLASCSDDRTIKIWQSYPVGNEEGIPTPDNVTVWKCVCTLSGQHSRSIYDISWCKLSGLLVTSCGDDIIRVFKESSDSKKNEPSFDLVYSAHRAHNEDVNTVRWNPAVKGLLVSTSDDGDVKVWKCSDPDP